MKVTLINCTTNALELLLGTKNTRLGFKSDPASWPKEKQEEHLAYMKDTIKSSWEMVDYVFQIEGVTRAFTHQLVRTRTGSYAQESQRTVDVRDHEVEMPLLSSDNEVLWTHAVQTSLAAYTDLIASGIPVQDARGILPTNMTTSIVAKFNLRTLHEMAKVRLCVRTQGEYQDVFRAMRAAVIEIHPWVEQFQFLEVHCAATGTCAFPRYGKASCKFYDPLMDLSFIKERVRARFWAEETQVAVPVAKDGKTM
jgi:flavin-dependent thymidylate synthase